MLILGLRSLPSYDSAISDGLRVLGWITFMQLRWRKRMEDNM